MDLFDDDEIPVVADDIDFDVNVTSIKPTAGKRVPGSDEPLVDDAPLDDEEDEESFEEKRARELAELEEGDDYLFNMDELEQ